MYEGLTSEANEWFLKTYKIENELIEAGTHLPTSDPERTISNKSTTGAAGTMINHVVNKVFETHAGSPYTIRKSTNPIDMKIHVCGGDQKEAARQIMAEYKVAMRDE